MARRLFEQHEQTEKHKCYGRRPGQTAVTKYTTNKPIIEYSDLSLSVRIQSAWWLAKEGIAILKYGSLVTSTLATHRYYSLTSNYLIISTDFQCLVYVHKVISIKTLVGILLILLENTSISWYESV